MHLKLVHSDKSPPHMGSWAAVAGAAASAYANKNKQGSGSSGKAGSPSMGPSGPSSPTTTTVSPTFQQSFTPQFSPNLVQQQDSPGAVASPTTTMVATTDQRAAGGSSILPGMGPGAPSPSFGYDGGYSSLPRRGYEKIYSDVFRDQTPFDINRYLPAPVPTPSPAQSMRNWTPYLVAGAVALAALGTFAYTRRSRRR